MGDWLPVEQSLSKDIRKLYTKSIMWTVIMTVITMIAFIILLALLQRGLVPANESENKALEASAIMKDNVSKYRDEQEFSKKQHALKEKDVYLSEYLINGEMVSGPEPFKSLFEERSISNVLNTTISSDGYYHRVVPINDHGEIKGGWVYSYKLKASFTNEYYRYIIVGILFLIFLSPVIYFILFSRHYINKLYKSIKHPIDELMKASYKISQKDLEFNLNYSSNNEIGKLTNSFRQMQKELKKSLYENWRKDSEWAVMMSSLSHDLKTPITLIGLSSETLANDQSLIEEQKNNVDIITRNIAKANSLLENMNVAGSIENPTVIRENKKLSVLTTEIEVDFKPLMKKKSICYSYKSTADMNIKVPYLKMNRVLQNIFSNAVQYTPYGGDILFIINQSNNQLQIAIENSGRGIEKENWENVFKKHYKEDQSRPNLHGNSGLGLYISRQLIESIKGTLVVTYPKEVNGVRFEILLPLDE